MGEGRGEGRARQRASVISLRETLRNPPSFPRRRESIPLLVGNDPDCRAVDDDEQAVARSLGDVPNEAVEVGVGDG